MAQPTLKDIKDLSDTLTRAAESQKTSYVRMLDSIKSADKIGKNITQEQATWYAQQSKDIEAMGSVLSGRMATLESMNKTIASYEESVSSMESAIDQMLKAHKEMQSNPFVSPAELAADQKRISQAMADHEAKNQRLAVYEGRRKSLVDQINKSYVEMTSKLQMASEKHEELVQHAKKYEELSAKTVFSFALFATAISTAFMGLDKLFMMAYNTHREYDAALAESESGLVHRTVLIMQALEVERELGAQSKVVAESMKYMVDLGLQRSANFKQDLKTSVILNQTLGVSAKSAASLAQATRGIKYDFREAANTAVIFSEKTSLSAEEAVKYSESLARSVRAFSSQGGGSNFKSITQDVLALESAMKDLTGQSGQIVDLVQKINRGDVFGTVLGVGSGVIKTQHDMENLYSNIEKITGGLNNMQDGIAKTMTAKAYGQAYFGGMSAENVLMMHEAVEKARKFRKENGAILASNNAALEKYNNQMATSGQGFTLLGNTVMAMIKEALIPLIAVAGAIAGTIATVITSLNSFGPTMYALKGAVILLGAAFIYFVALRLPLAITLIRGAFIETLRSLDLLSKKLQETANSARMAAASQTAVGVTGARSAAAGNIGGLNKGLMVASLLASILPSLVSNFKQTSDTTSGLNSAMDTTVEWLLKIVGFASQAYLVWQVLGFIAPGAVASITTALGGLATSIAGLPVVIAAAVPLAIAAAVASVGYLGYVLVRDWKLIMFSFGNEIKAVGSFLKNALKYTFPAGYWAVEASKLVYSIIPTLVDIASRGVSSLIAYVTDWIKSPIRAISQWISTLMLDLKNLAIYIRELPGQIWEKATTFSTYTNAAYGAAQGLVGATGMASQVTSPSAPSTRIERALPPGELSNLRMIEEMRKTRESIESQTVDMNKLEKDKMFEGQKRDQKARSTELLKSV